MKFGFCAALICLTACGRVNPSVCETVQMTESEFVAYEALADDLRPDHCAIQVRPDNAVDKVQFT